MPGTRGAANTSFQAGGSPRRRTRSRRWRGMTRKGSRKRGGGGRNLFAYSTSKGGLLTMTRNLAKAYARHKVRVNYVIPGWVITETEIEIQALEGHDEEWIAQAARRLPGGRHQVPEDAAGTVL